MRALGRLLAAVPLVLRGRRRVPPGAQTIGYGHGLGLVAAALLAGALLEVVVATVLVPWPVVRAVLVVIGLLVVVLVVTAWCANVGYPHLVDPEALRLRQGATGWQDVPLSAVLSVGPSARSWSRSGVLADGDQVGYVVGGRTQVAVALARPVDLRVRHGVVATRTLHLSVDSVEEALAAFREAVGGRGEE